MYIGASTRFLYETVRVAEVPHNHLSTINMWSKDPSILYVLNLCKKKSYEFRKT